MKLYFMQAQYYEQKHQRYEWMTYGFESTPEEARKDFLESELAKSKKYIKWRLFEFDAMIINAGDMAIQR